MKVPTGDKLIGAANTAAFYCIIIIDAYAKVQLEAGKTKVTVHTFPLKSASHTFEGMASIFWKKATPVSKNSSDRHTIEVVIFKSID